MLGGLSGFPLGLGGGSTIGQYYEAMKDGLGSIASNDPTSIIQAETIAYAHLLGAASIAATLPAALNIPQSGDVNDWANRLGLSRLNGEGDSSLRKRCLRKYRISLGCSKVDINESIKTALGGHCGTIYWHDSGNLGTLDGGDFGDWQSSKCIITVEILPLGQSVDYVAYLGNVVLRQYVDPILPSWADVHWNFGEYTGFTVGESLLGAICL